MKRRLFSLFLMLIMMFSVGMTASAVYRPEIGMPTINGTRSAPIWTVIVLESKREGMVRLR